MSDTKKYYWLKLKKDFFKRHDIQIIEAMPNGKDYILFYLKMLVESVDHDGNLRFSDTVPYNESMIATISNTNVDIVRSAMKVFIELNMMEVLEDKTIYMLEMERMLGTETYWAEQKRKHRSIGQCPKNVLPMSNVSNQEKEREIDIEKELDIDIEKERDKEMENSLSEKTFEILKFYETKTTVSIIAHYQFIYSLVELYPMEDIQEAIQKALDKGIKNKSALDYAKGILQNWITEGKEAASGGSRADSKSDNRELKIKGNTEIPDLGDLKGEFGEV